MSTVRTITVERLSWHLVWIVAALEGVAVSVLPYVSRLPSEGHVSKPPAAGLLLGYIGMLTALLLVNAFGSRIPAIGRLSFCRPCLDAVWGGVYLALIFIAQSVFDFTPYTLVTTMARAALSIATATIVVLFLYRGVVSRYCYLSVGITLDGNSARIMAVSIIPAVVCLALYEALALPGIEILRKVPVHRWLAGLCLGTVFGAAATTTVVLVYNNLSRMLPGLRLRIMFKDRNFNATS